MTMTDTDPWTQIQTFDFVEYTVPSTFDEVLQEDLRAIVSIPGFDREAVLDDEDRDFETLESYG